MIDSVREDLENAIAELEDGVPSEGEIIEARDGEMPYEPPAERDDSETAEATEAQASEEESETKESSSTRRVSKSDEAVSGKQANESLKAPLGWTPKAREGWSKIDKETQQLITDREREVATTLQETKDAREVAQRVATAVQPFHAIMAAEGITDPIKGIEGLLQTTARLRMGSPQQKAAQVASIIKEYGVDISTLDSLLVGDPIESEPTAPPTDPRLDQLFALLEQHGTQAQRQSQTAAATEVEQFKTKAEFLDDVRHDMADLIDLAQSRGQSIGLEEAYNKACAINPQIQAVLDQRKQDDAIRGGGSAIARKRAAASSLSGRQSGSGAGSGELSLRDTIAAAWDEIG